MQFSSALDMGFDGYLALEDEDDDDDDDEDSIIQTYLINLIITARPIGYLVYSKILILGLNSIPPTYTCTDP